LNNNKSERSRAIGRTQLKL